MRKRKFWIAGMIAGTALAIALAPGLTACSAEGGGYGAGVIGLPYPPPPPIITVPGDNLGEKFEWLQENVQPGNPYALYLTGDEEFTEAVRLEASFESGFVDLRFYGEGGERTISRTWGGTLFEVGTGVYLGLYDGITLQGSKDGREERLVVVEAGGTLQMYEGSKIIDNADGGVYVDDGGSFGMYGGTISGNEAEDGGGVYVAAGGTFTTSAGGAIFGNTASNEGAGVYVESGGTFGGNSSGVSDEVVDKNS